MYFPWKSASSVIFYSNLCNSFSDVSSQLTDNTSSEIIKW